LSTSIGNLQIKTGEQDAFLHSRTPILLRRRMYFIHKQSELFLDESICKSIELDLDLLNTLSN